MMTEVFETSWKGLGLRAAESIPPNKLVMEYCGEVLDPYEFYRRSQLYAETSQQHFYFMALSQEEVGSCLLNKNFQFFQFNFNV